MAPCRVSASAAAVTRQVRAITQWGTHVAMLSTQSIVFSIRGVNASQNRWFPDVVRNRR